MTPRHRQLDTLSDILRRAANDVPQIFDHLDEQRAMISVLAAQQTDSSHSSSGISDPTGRIVEHLSHIEYRRAAIKDAIDTLNICVRMLSDAQRDALNTRAPSELAVQPGSKPRCIGDNTVDGAVCEQIPTERPGRDGSRIDDGRCLDCGRRYDHRKREAQRQRDMRQRESA